MVEVSTSEYDLEIPDITEFLEKFLEIAERRYEEFGLAGYVAIVTRDIDGLFHIVAQGVNEREGRKGWGGDVLDPIGRAVATLTGVQTRVRANAILLNDSCALASVSDNGKGYPEKNDERDAQIIFETLAEMSEE